MPQDLNPHLERPELSRDPYETPVSPNPPLFFETSKVTEERISMINFGSSGWLSEEDINLLKNPILLRQKYIAFCEEERGILKHYYGKPYKIPVIPHEPWQQKPIPIPKLFLPQFIELVREQICTGLYEQSPSSYNRPVFCVAKPNGKLRKVHELQDPNKIKIKDAGLPQNVDGFVGLFSGRAFYGLGDIMGGYNAKELDITKRPLTTFETKPGRLQLTRLPQGATDNVAVHQVQMTRIPQEEIPENLGIFTDDGGIEGPISMYQHETSRENQVIRRFVWEYAVTLERILFRIEEPGLTISGSKFACCVPALHIMGHVVSFGGRKISKQKINKIQNWPRTAIKKEVRGLLGLCAYVRMFINNFSQVAAPLRRLTREDVLWKWDEQFEEAFIKLRKIVGEEMTLRTLNYDKGSGKIKLTIDSSYIEAGAVLRQEDENRKDRPVLYESVTFSRLESKYSQPKLELCDVARILKKLQTILWVQHFELQVDAKALIEMINTPFLPNAPMTIWVAFIQLFSFDLVHKPGKTFTMPDGLSRRPKGEDKEGSERDDFDED
ncbi:hypothetical protein O181_089042 [Austropuccinia psidii MF-1]|uniref:Reverse transcriptase RNase H-like domain-containing protein n=1 Tax=Austropuccinia psidii MF-1 TaxID=1389203 RepID=A0A9Q3ISP3_9BASI|nr:hypothetical protein [Austropuccinia psidii MF-1]